MKKVFTECKTIVCAELINIIFKIISTATQVIWKACAVHSGSYPVSHNVKITSRNSLLREIYKKNLITHRTTFPFSCHLPVYCNRGKC